ncbi:Sak single strand annealing protein, partial [Lactobacillus taiwanensis]
VKAQALDMKLINKAQQRCLVKALATAGLGLEIYAGEDLPEEPQQKQTAPKPAQKPVRRQATPSKPKKMTKDQLYGYQADYNGEKKFLVTIYTECDKQKKMGLDAKKSVPIEWWHEKLKENSADGEAVRQFTEMAIEANKKKEAKAKIKQSDKIPDYAKDPEVEKLIEESIS